MSRQKEIQCKDIGCNLPHVWYEEAADGSRMICFKTKSLGKWHVKKYKLPKDVRELEAAAA